MSKRKPPRASTSYPTSRVSPGLPTLKARRFGGAYPYNGVISWDINFTYSGAGRISMMSGFTGSYRQFCRQYPHFTERPYHATYITWDPWVATNTLRLNYSPTNSYDNSSGNFMEQIFGALTRSGTNAQNAIFWNKIPLGSTSLNSNRANDVTVECWKRVDPAGASSLVSGLEAHKTLKLLNSKGRALVALADAAKISDKVFRQVLTKHTGIDFRKQPVPKRYLVWDPVSGVPLHNGRGTTFARYGRYRWESRTDLLGEASKLLLEYRYGWKIMVMEIVDQLKAFYAEDLRGELTRYKHATQVARVKKEFTDDFSAQVTGSDGISYYGTCSNHVHTKMHAWIRWKLKEERLFRRLNDYGMFDITRSLYDVIPYSFVLDMVADVSGYLSAVDAYLKADVQSSGFTYSVLHTVTRTCTGSNASSFKWPPLIPNGATETLTVRDFQRKSSLEFPRHPTINVKLGIYNLATLAALAKTGADSVRTLRV